MGIATWGSPQDRRTQRRGALLNAINGDFVIMLEYVNLRAMTRTFRGLAEYDEARLTRLAAHWFARLSKLAKKARES